jgi:hypothetical protein
MMNSLWWLALPVLALPVWWHRQKREQKEADVLATARFLPRAEPKQVRVWRWNEPLLLLVRCLLLATLVAWLADPVLAWRGDTVIVATGTDAAWVDKQLAQAGLHDAKRLELPAVGALGWLGAHEREFRPDARLLVVGDLPMPAVRPRFAHRVELRTLARPFAKTEHHVAIVSDRPAAWSALFAAIDGPQRFIVDGAPGPATELVIWDVAQAPPAGLRAPLWWVPDATAFPELKQAKEIDGMRYADSARGRLWSSAAWSAKDADGARKLFETWQQLHYAPLAYTAPATALAPAGAAPVAEAGGALRDTLMMVLAALFALERILAHARRR